MIALIQFLSIRTLPHTEAIGYNRQNVPPDVVIYAGIDSLAKILVVDDDLVLCALVSDWLTGQRYAVETTHDGLSALEMLKLGGFDLVVLDWDLPGKPGIDVLKEFRDWGGQTPVIMLTAKGEAAEKEKGFDYGVDDYVTKPFGVRELAARVRAVLRRPPAIASDVLISGDVELNRSKHTVTKAGVPVKLQPKDFTLLEFFMSNPHQTFSPDVLLTRVWASDSEASVDALRTAIKRIRQAIDTAGGDTAASIIKTVPRVGYTLGVRD